MKQALDRLSKKQTARRAASGILLLASCFLLPASCLLLLVSLCYAQPVSSSELINNAKEYDGKIIIFAGEVVGEVMVRGAYAWVNVKDEENAIGVWMDRDLAQQITYAGGYKFRGDRIEVRGTFQRSCSQHGGDLDIHAQQIRKIKAGEAIPEQLSARKRNLLIALLGGLCLILILKRLKIR